MSTNEFTLYERYEYLKDLVISGNTERSVKFKEFMEFIETETDFLTAPASTKYHLCREGGLLEHVVNVATYMIKLKTVIAPTITNEQCVIVGLLHDLGKAGYPGQPQYIENEPTERQKQFGYPANPPYKYNENIVFLPHAHRSIYLMLSHGLELSPEECQAILAHDGQYIVDNKSYANKEEKLTFLLHTADYYSSRFLEE